MIASDERIFRGRSQGFAGQHTRKKVIVVVSCPVFEESSVTILRHSLRSRRLEHLMTARKAG
jgi:hypothetical protein